MNSKKDRRIAKLTASVMIIAGRCLCVAIIVFSLAYWLEYAGNSPYGNERFAVRTIELTGTEHADSEALQAIVRRSLPVNLLQADVDQIRSIVESEPWVKSATVRRVLPDRLLVAVEEHEPAAIATIDGELYLVDFDGNILDRYGSRHQSIGGPIVKGLINVARENAREENRARMAVYHAVIAEFQAAPEDLLNNISEIDVGNPRRTALVPADDPIPVYVGDHAFLERYRRFLESRNLFEELKRQYGSIEYIDVTFEDKIIFHRPQDQQALIQQPERF
ncbi:MAG TPA: FtsQ-type POTRA domain-containing protein [Acidobacteriota bacterium]|nr:FtsQ-type POTRA domain-containing protein [Acidobacteriota bacterium]